MNVSFLNSSALALTIAFSSTSLASSGLPDPIFDDWSPSHSPITMEQQPVSQSNLIWSKEFADEVSAANSPLIRELGSPSQELSDPLWDHSPNKRQKTENKDRDQDQDKSRETKPQKRDPLAIVSPVGKNGAKKVRFSRKLEVIKFNNRIAYNPDNSHDWDYEHPVPENLNTVIKLEIPDTFDADDLEAPKFIDLSKVFPPQSEEQKARNKALNEHFIMEGAKSAVLNGKKNEELERLHGNQDAYWENLSQVYKTSAEREAKVVFDARLADEDGIEERQIKVGRDYASAAKCLLAKTGTLVEDRTLRYDSVKDSRRLSEHSSLYSQYVSLHLFAMKYFVKAAKLVSSKRFKYASSRFFKSALTVIDVLTETLEFDNSFKDKESFRTDFKFLTEIIEYNQKSMMKCMNEFHGDEDDSDVLEDCGRCQELLDRQALVVEKLEQLKKLIA